MRKILRALVPVFTVISLAACNSSSDDAPPVNLAEITSANAPIIAGAVIEATYEGGEMGSFANLFGGVGSAFPKTAGVYSKVGEVQMEYTKAMLTDSQIGTFQAPIAPTAEDCAVSGSTMVSGTTQNSETLTINDVIIIQFMACNDGLSVVDGTMTMTIRDFSGDFVNGSVYFSVTVNLDLVVTADGMTQTANGDLTLSMDFPSTGPITMTMTMTTDNLTIGDGTSTEALASFSLTQTIDPVANTYTLTVSGRISSSAFDGAVDFSTTIALEGSGEAYANLGEIVVTGDANATITIRALDAQLIRLDVDLDGDGTIDEVIDTSWDALTA